MKYYGQDRRLLAKFTRGSQFVDNVFCKPEHYFEKLSDYKFFACPYESKYKYIDWQKEKSKFLVENFQSLLK